MKRVISQGILAALGFSCLGVVFVRGILKDSSVLQREAVVDRTIDRNIFSQTYPLNLSFVEELSQMRNQRQIAFQIENAIHTSIQTTSSQLSIPRALLWCLLFQESRLNPLSGVRKGALTTGLGQFGQSAFFEVNHHLYRYLSAPKETFSQILGKDVRPVRADLENTSALHSYYFIPTAITASGLYLTNRWIQLKRAAEARGLKYSDDVLWGWSALAYNKGARTVLGIWQHIQEQRGQSYLEASLTRKPVFLEEAQNKIAMESAMSRIWSKSRVSSYTQELYLHARNIQECSIISSQPPSKEEL